MLGRKDLRALLNWWKVLHEETVKPVIATEETIELKDTEKEEKDADLSDEENIEKQISELQVFS